jgi:hypothetical protein
MKTVKYNIVLKNRPGLNKSIYERRVEVILPDFKYNRES